MSGGFIALKGIQNGFYEVRPLFQKNSLIAGEFKWDPTTGDITTACLALKPIEPLYNPCTLNLSKTLLKCSSHPFEMLKSKQKSLFHAKNPRKVSGNRNILPMDKKTA